MTTVATGVLTARLLEVSERGTYASTLAFCSTLSFVCTAGAAEALVLAPKRGVHQKTSNTIAWSYSTFFSVVCAIPVFFYTSYLGANTPLFVLLACVLPFLGALGSLINYSLVSDGKFLAAAFLRVSPVVVQILSIAALVAFGEINLTSIFATSVFGSCAAVVLGISLNKPWRRMHSKMRRNHAVQTLRIGFKTGGAQVFRSVGSRMDLILVAMFLSTTDAGMYSVAASLTVAGLSLVASLAPVLLSRSRSDSARLTSVASAMAVLVGVAIVLVGPLLLPYVYGSEYAAAGILLYSLSAAMVASNLFELMLRIMQQDAQELGALLAVIIATVSQFELVVLACLLLGVNWVALGTAVSYLLGIATLLAVNRRSGGDSLLARVSPWRGIVHIWGIFRPGRSRRISYETTGRG
ncbi:oligosaccharide flippase family protein [Rhodococcus sp. BGS-1C]|nr:oligosaccharide flippase family protein [Rhodococcus sp. I2R]